MTEFRRVEDWRVLWVLRGLFCKAHSSIDLKYKYDNDKMGITETSPINCGFKCSSAKYSCFPLTSALPFFILHISYPSTSASVPKETKGPFWHSNMANSSSFLGKDRGGREEWNKLLSGLKPFTCACVNPAKSRCYLLPVQSDQRGTRCAVSPGATAGVSHTVNTLSAIPEKQRTAKTPSAPEWTPKGSGTPLGTVGSLHGYHPHGKREEEGREKNPPKTKPHNHRTI